MSIADIARKAGVSVATVSRVINGSAYVLPETKRRVEQAMSEMKYSPNLVARSLATKESRTIGLMIPHIRSPFFSGFAAGVEERADELGYVVILCDTRESLKWEKKYLQVLASRQVDGIIATPVGGEYGHFTDVSPTVPVVFAARTFSGVGISSVVVDNAAGSRRVVKHLIDQGHRRIGIINGPLFVSSGLDRWTGVKQAMDESSVEIDPTLIKEGDFTAAGGYQAAMELIRSEPRPTAIFTANHMTTVGCLKALRENNLKFPDDVAIASFEGFQDTVFDYLVWPPITANEHPTKAMAVTAMDLLVEAIRDNRIEKRSISKDVVLNTRLVITASTKKADEGGA